MMFDNGLQVAMPYQEPAVHLDSLRPRTCHVIYSANAPSITKECSTYHISGLPLPYRSIDQSLHEPVWSSFQHTAIFSGMAFSLYLAK